MIEIEDLCGPEWADWYALSPQERWEESAKLWSAYLALGGADETALRSALHEEEEREREADRRYWEPLRKELERLRRAAAGKRKRSG